MKPFITGFINVKSKSNSEDNGQVWKVCVCACAFFVWRAKFETIKIIAKNFWVQMSIFIWWEISVGILRQMMGRRDNWKQCGLGRVLQFVCYIRFEKNCENYIVYVKVIRDTKYLRICQIRWKVLLLIDMDSSMYRVYIKCMRYAPNSFHRW